MREDHTELLAALKAEEESSLGFYQSELMTDQRKALEQYYGEPYGDEAPDRSSVVTREIFETIEWLRPDLRRIFTAGSKAVEFTPTKPEHEAYAEQATQYINWIFYEDNEGDRIIDAFAFDGLLHRLGFAGVWWDEAEYSKPEKVTGLTLQQVQTLASDPSVEILEYEEEQGQPDEAHPDGVFYRLKIKSQKRPGCVKIMNVAPEDIRVASRTTNLDDARYIGRIVRVTKSDLRRMFPKHREEIDQLGPANDDVDYDERRQARFAGEEEYDNLSSMFREGAQELIMLEEYIRYDLDEDGYDELVGVKRVNDTIFEVVEVDDHPFECWTPIPIPHRLFGLGVWDIMKDVQRIKTVALRAALDATYQAVVPRVAADASTVNMADLLTPKPGGIIRVRGEPRAALMPFQVPDLAPSALQMMEYVDQMGESRSGVTRNAQGLDPDSLNKTATGIRLMQNAASSRKEEIARNLAVGLEKLFRKVYRTVVRHQDAARVVKLSPGQYVEFDPRAWDSDMRVSAHVGLGTGDREARVMQLERIGQYQERWMGAFGPQNGVIGPQHVHHTYDQMIKEMGYRSSEPFIGRVENFQPPPPQEDPKVALEKQKLQMQMQAKQADMQMDQQKMQMDAQMDQQKAQIEAVLDKERLEREMELKREEILAQIQLKREQIAAELELKREQMAAELALKERYGMSGGGSQVNIGGDPG